jgi:Putative endonuclease, protein of unknown function (DUF1780)
MKNEKLIKAVEQTEEAYKNQKLRECVVFGEFLSRLKINFQESEIIQPKDDPPDVIFRGNQFEILFCTGSRKPHKEAKEHLKKAKEYNDIYVDRKLLEKEKISYSQLVALVEHNLKCKKSDKYSQDFKKNINVLVLVMLPKFPDIDSSFPDINPLIVQGWGSISVMISQYALVLHGSFDAPEFINAIVRTPTLSPSPEWWVPTRWQ